MLIDFNDILGKPYKAHGRGPESFDCYGLVIEVAKRLGHTMPDLYTRLADSWETDPHNINFSAEKEGLVKVDDCQFGDVIIFFDEKGRIFHTGIYLKNDDFIHCNKDGVHISKVYEYSNYREVYRWK